MAGDLTGVPIEAELEAKGEGGATATRNDVGGSGPLGVQRAANGVAIGPDLEAPGVSPAWGYRQGEGPGAGQAHGVILVEEAAVGAGIGDGLHAEIGREGDEVQTPRGRGGGHGQLELSCWWLMLPSVTNTVMATFPVAPGSGVSVIVRLASVPPKKTVLVGTSAGSAEKA